MKKIWLSLLIVLLVQPVFGQSDLSDLDAKLKKFAPIESIAITDMKGSMNDPGNVKIKFRPEATQAEKDAAMAELALFDKTKDGARAIQMKIADTLNKLANRNDVTNAQFIQIKGILDRSELATDIDKKRSLMQEAQAVIAQIGK